jgi:MATE family multidrug resistance protein
MWAMLASALWLSGDGIPKLYTNIEEVQKIMLPLVHIFSAVGFPDTAQSIMSGSLRAMGRNNLAALTYAITFYCVMLPLGIFFAWPLHMGVNGIWWSMFVGTGLSCTVFAVSLVFRTDWIAIAAEAHKNMNELGASARDETASQDGLSMSPADMIKVVTEVESGS